MSLISEESKKELKEIKLNFSVKSRNSIDEIVTLLTESEDNNALFDFCKKHKYNDEFNQMAYYAIQILVSNNDIELDFIDHFMNLYASETDDVLDALIDLVDYLEDVASQLGGQQYFPELFAIIRPVIGGQVAFDISFLSSGMLTLWNTVELDIKELALFSIVIHIMGMRIERDNGEHISFRTFFETKKEVKAPTPCPLFKYHPERFKQSRKYSRDAFDPSNRRKIVENGLYTSMESLQHMVGVISQEYNHKNSTSPLKERLKFSKNASQMMGEEIAIFTEITHFLQAGKQIFDINSGLVELFKNSSVDEIPLECIKLPYESLFLSFGKQDIEVAEGWFFDGAYVSYQEQHDTLKITITSIHDDVATNLDWTRGDITTYSISIPYASSKKDLAIAITEAIAQQLNDLGGGLEELDEEIDVDGMKVINASHKNKEAKEKSLKSRHEAFKKAVVLIVNSLCYLSAYSKDRPLIWPQNTPEKLVKQVKGKNKKEASAARKKLFQLGYTKVYSVNPTEEQSQVIKGHSEGSVHWRRSHWKTQPYGPKSLLRKLIWIMPTIVNRKGDDDIDNLKGHIYVN